MSVCDFRSVMYMMISAFIIIVLGAAAIAATYMLIGDYFDSKEYDSED